MVYSQSDSPQDVVSLFPYVLHCFAQVSEQLVRAGVEVYMEPQPGSVIYGREVIVVWRWRIRSLGAASILGYASLHDALLEAILYFIRNSGDPEGVLLPRP